MNVKEIVHRAGEKEPLESNVEKIPPFVMRKVVLGFTKKKNRPPTPKELEALEAATAKRYFGKSEPNFEAKDEKPTIDRYGIENGKTVKLTPEELKALVDIASMPMSEEDKKKINEFMENHKTVIF